MTPGGDHEGLGSRTEPAPPDRLGILCHEVMDANFLTAVLYRVRGDLPVDVFYSLASLEAWAATVTPATRLMAFCSGVVVPAGVLSRLSGPSYNFHPGSPDYPGRYPTAFAIYDGASTFGATLHEMTPRVDSGPIVGHLQFSVPPGSSYQWLAAKTHQATLHLFLEVVEGLALSPTPFHHLGIPWGQRRCSQKALDAACRLPLDVSDHEIERRRRSFAQVPGTGLHVMLQGRRFDLRD